eukprot:GHVS01027218.1.p1 GENE.GHVS01027218.1~~GHVS01027218.1.p1  ORF type:complete len:853 (-),score=49.87 GHVS01027218.1:89-2647(-)
MNPHAMWLLTAALPQVLLMVLCSLMACSYRSVSLLARPNRFLLVSMPGSFGESPNVQNAAKGFTTAPTPISSFIRPHNNRACGRTYQNPLTGRTVIAPVGAYTSDARNTQGFVFYGKIPNMKATRLQMATNQQGLGPYRLEATPNFASVSGRIDDDVLLSNNTERLYDRLTGLFNVTAVSEIFTEAISPVKTPDGVQPLNSEQFEEWMHSFGACLRPWYNSSLAIAIPVPANVTQRYWNIVVEGFRQRINRTAIPDVDNPIGFGCCPTMVSNRTDCEVLRALSLRRLKGITMQMMADQVLMNIIRRKHIAAIGRARLILPLERTVYEFAPGKDFVMEVMTDVWPVVKFVKPYVDLKLRVPIPAYPKGLAFNETLKDLSMELARPFKLKSPRPAKRGDHVELRLIRGRKIHDNGTEEIMGHEELPEQDFNVTMVDSNDWVENPEGLIESLIGIVPGGQRTIEMGMQLLDPGEAEAEMIPPRAEVISDAARKTDSYKPSNVEPFSTALLYDRPEEKTMEEEPRWNTTEPTHNQTSSHPRMFRCLLDTVCTAVKGRRPAFITDECIVSRWNKTRDEVYDLIEEECLYGVQRRSYKSRRGAVAQRLEDCTRIHFPMTLIEQHGRRSFATFIDNERRSGSLEEGMETEEYYLYWREKNYAKIARELTGCFTVSAIRASEGLEVDREEVAVELEKVMLKMPQANITAAAHNCYDKIETRMVYDWVAERSRVDYYTEEKPLVAKVDSSLSGKQQKNYDTWTHYMPGVNPDSYERNREAMDAQKQKQLEFAKQVLPDSEQTSEAPKQQPITHSIDGASSEELSDEDIVSVVKESNRRRRVKLRERGINPEDAVAIEPIAI